MPMGRIVVALSSVGVPTACVPAIPVGLTTAAPDPTAGDPAADACVTEPGVMVSFPSSAGLPAAEECATPVAEMVEAHGI